MVDLYKMVSDEFDRLNKRLEEAEKQKVTLAKIQEIIATHDIGSIDEQDAYNGICKLVEPIPKDKT